MKKLVTVMASLALVLTGCATIETKASDDETVEYPATYRSVEDLKDAFVRAGGICNEWEQTNRVKLAAESGTCSESNVLSIYPSEAVKDQALTAFRSLGPLNINLLVGENWIINDPTVKELNPEIGGVFVNN